MEYKAFIVFSSTSSRYLSLSTLQVWGILGTFEEEKKTLTLHTIQAKAKLIEQKICVTIYSALKQCTQLARHLREQQ